MALRTNTPFKRFFMVLTGITALVTLLLALICGVILNTTATGANYNTGTTTIVFAVFSGVGLLISYSWYKENKVRF